MGLAFKIKDTISTKLNILLIQMEPHSTEVDSYIPKTTIVDLDHDLYKINPSQKMVLVKINCDEMEPSIFPGDVVVCRKVNKMIFPPKKTAAVIITKNKIKVSRLYKPSENKYFLLINDNKTKKEWEKIARNEILQLFIIRKKLITRKLSPKVKKRIRAMEKSLELLKKETSRVKNELTKLES